LISERRRHGSGRVARQYSATGDIFFPEYDFITVLSLPMRMGSDPSGRVLQ
jgi:hypothetical protein